MWTLPTIVLIEQCCIVLTLTLLVLQISQISLADSGEYACVASSDIGSVATKATLTVIDRPDPPSKPTVKTQVGTSVHLEWQPPSTIPCGQIQVIKKVSCLSEIRNHCCGTLLACPRSHYHLN